jgi:hypothetical protein
MRPEHANNLEFYQKERAMKQQLEQDQKRSAELSHIERNVIGAVGALLQHLQGKTSKVEVTNQLQDVMSGKDAKDLVKSLDKIDKSVLASQTDTKPLEELLKQAITQLQAIPKTHAEAPEQLESVKVSNLSEIDLKPLEKAVKGLKLNVEAPKVNVEAPVVKVDAPDMSYLDSLRGDLKKLLGEVVTAVGKVELPETNLENVEKELRDQTKELKTHTEKLDKLIKQPKGGGGGGGGNGTPYIDSTGKPVNVEVETDGSVPVTVVAGGSSATTNYAKRADEDSATPGIYYFGKAAIGAAEGDPVWQIKRIDTTTISAETTWAEDTGTADDTFVQIWTDRESLTYS